MTYCYVCRDCGARYSTQEYGEGCRNPECFSDNVRRDYRAEAVNVDRSWSETR